MEPHPPEEPTEQPPGPVPPGEAHVEVLARQVWRVLTTVPSGPSFVGDLVRVAGRSRDLLGAGTAGLARRTVGSGPGRALLTPVLSALRQGGSLQADLVRLIERMLEDVTEDRDGAAPLDDAGAPPDLELDVPLAQIEEAIAQGVQAAIDRGQLRTGHPADVLAWTLTSLLVTVLMRAREGEDVQQLVAAATAAMEHLLHESDPTIGS